ncbi:MAG: dTDP-4-dehydrorhamnose 3,5-epimerase [Ferruginibacter sp.]|nr:dTDP-4-dehydrorhamnose 3,5-epimerase [Cytophagales bacterium]
MKFIPTSLRDAFIVELEPFQDQRGLFARTFDKQQFASIGHRREFVQFNHSVTNFRGTLRGLHYQVPPSCEVKLIRCVRGRVHDVIVDVRKDSPTFRQHLAVELSDDNLRMLYIPEGFAHGFQTLADDTQLIYHHSAYYNPASERGIRYSDPALGIQWPLTPTVVSEKDQQYALLNPDFEGVTP